MMLSICQTMLNGGEKSVRRGRGMGRRRLGRRRVGRRGMVKKPSHFRLSQFLYIRKVFSITSF
jgi:hypothetical protein